MATAGRFGANFHFTGLRANDPLPRKMLRFRTIDKLENRIIASMKRAANPMKEAMEKGAPVRTGALSQSFGMEKLNKTPARVVGIRVGGVSGEGVWQGQSFQKMGWRDHWAELGTQNHPGHPHVQPAIKSKLATYRANLRKELAALIQQYSR